MGKASRRKRQRRTGDNRADGQSASRVVRTQRAAEGSAAAILNGHAAPTIPALGRSDGLAVWGAKPDGRVREITNINDTTTGEELHSLLQRDPASAVRVAYAALTRAAARDVSPQQRLLAITVVSEAVDAVRFRLVGQARDAGASWAEIGECLRVTAQAAHKRFAGPVAERV